MQTFEKIKRENLSTVKIAPKIVCFELCQSDAQFLQKQPKVSPCFLPID